VVLIDNLTDAADQQTDLLMPDGSTGTLELIYLGTAQRWIFNFTHPSFPGGALNGQNLCQHPNILRQWKNILPFGLACFSADGNDPVSVEDFASGNTSLFLLDAADVDAVEQSFFGAQT
jgi:hypothetical protein